MIYRWELNESIRNSIKDHELKIKVYLAKKTFLKEIFFLNLSNHEFRRVYYLLLLSRS
ncbi:hypothetical protein ABIB62_004101 [Mucilaginibacter sp. UYP25]